MNVNKNQSPAVAQKRHRTATITLPVNNDYGLVSFDDLLMELSRRFNEEKNLKNEAYSFILSNGHTGAFAQFRGQEQNPHEQKMEVVC